MTDTRGRAERSSALVTLLFTDLVGSTELLSRAGDEEAHQIFRAHHDLLTRTASAHGGEEVKWLGDGLMVAFPSAADAVRCAIAMQRASRHWIHGERLAIRVGLNAGEALREAADYFGLPVVVAHRLCDRAEAGQILCAEMVAGLLATRAGFAFTELGRLDLKGVPEPVSAFMVRYDLPETQAAVRGPIVGREAEIGRLAEHLAEATSGWGGIMMVAGEPGIGKTRLAEELAERAERDGTAVLWGHCFEGEWAPPYAPFAEALETLALAADPEQLRADLGLGAAPLAQLVPAFRKVLPDLPEPVPIEPNEERFRLLDSLAQLLIARSQRSPLLVVLDDLHWADKGSIAVLRHLARFASRHRLLILGTYRDVEVVPGHPLAEALGALPREMNYQHLHLEGLAAGAVGELISALAEHEVSGEVTAAITDETEGNPFFVRQVVRHLIEERKVHRGPDGRWTTDLPIRELGIPEEVREVIGRRLSRLSGAASRLLTVGSAFEGSFRFDVVAGLADLGEAEGLDALDEGLAAQLIQPSGMLETYAFTHALIRQTLYAELSPSRQLRLHRRVAEALDSRYGDDASPTEAGEIANHYHRSAVLGGGERGVEPALAAAAHAEVTGAHDEAANFLRMALTLLPGRDPRRPRLLGRLGILLAWALAFDDAVEVAVEAGGALAAAEGEAAASQYFSEATYACAIAGSSPHAWALAREGLGYAGDRRDVAWALLLSFDQERRAAEDPEHPGIPADTSERRQAAQILQAAELDPFGFGPMVSVYDSRAEACASPNFAVLTYEAGDYARCLSAFQAEADAALSRGQLARAARCSAFAAVHHIALGALEEARSAFARAQELAGRVGQPMPALLYPQEHLGVAMDGGWEEIAPIFEALSGSPRPAFAWALGFVYAGLSRIAAREGKGEEALRLVSLLVPWLEFAPAWTISFPIIAAHAAETLWLLERLDHAEVVERALRDKVITPDFRAPMVDGRLALARICALTGRHDEAVGWFDEARRVLDEQGARPLLAITDYDEARMCVRRGEPGDLDRARPLLDTARRQFEAIGMTGWIERAERLAERLA